MKVCLFIIFIGLLVTFWTYGLTHATYIPLENQPPPKTSPEVISNILKCKDKIQITHTTDSNLFMSDECLLSIPDTFIYNKSTTTLCRTEVGKKNKTYIYGPCNTP